MAVAATHWFVFYNDTKSLVSEPSPSVLFLVLDVVAQSQTSVSEGVHICQLSRWAKVKEVGCRPKKKKNLDADATICASIPDVFAAGAASVASTSTATAILATIKQQVEGGEVLKLTS